MICKYCGAQVEEGTVCPACGAALETRPAAPEKATEAPEQPLEPAPEAETPASAPEQSSEPAPEQTPEPAPEAETPASSPEQTSEPAPEQTPEPVPEAETPASAPEQTSEPAPEAEQAGTIAIPLPAEPAQEEEAPKKAKKEKKEKIKKEKAPREPKKRRAEKTHKSRPAVPIRFGRVFWPAIALLLPIVYFAIDLFGNLASALAEKNAENVSNLTTLFGRIASPDYATATVPEIAADMVPEGTSFLQSVSFFSLFRGECDGFFLPLFATLALALVSVAAGVLLLITAGRALRARWVSDLVIVGGVGATFAPLFGGFVWRLGMFFKTADLAAVDDAAIRFCLSPESIFMMGFSVIVILPAVASLRRTAALSRGETQCIAAPYRFMPQSFNATRIVALAAGAGAVAVAVLYCFLPVLTVGDLFAWGDVFRQMLPDIVTQSKALFRLLTGSTVTAELPSLTAPFLKLAFYLLLPLAIYTLWHVLRYLVRLFMVRENSVGNRKSDHRILIGGARRMRRLVLLPYIVYCVLQIVLVAVLLFLSPVAGHLDFADVDTTLQVLYLTIGYVKSLCGTTTLFAFLAAAGALLWHTSSNMALHMLNIGDE